MTKEVYTWPRKHAKTVVAILVMIVLGLVLVSHSSVSLSIEAPGIKVHVDAR